MSAPRQIGRYEIKGLIARGGMGDLYLARDPKTTRLVVVKLLSATLESTDLRERFEREARSLASLNHPNIVHIYDYGDLDDNPFIVIEYVRGETLAEKIKRRESMTVAYKLKLMTELCAGLAHAHAAGIIHRDVKPSNLMVDQDDRLKILDFGIARVADSNLTRFGVLASQLVMQIGTPGYMSPEQIQGGDIDARADVFGIGAVCYNLLAYRDPFTGKDADEVERNVMLASPVPLASLVPGLDPEVDAIVTRALAKSREKRFPDASSMGEALERCRVRLPADPASARRDAAHGKAAAPADAAYQRAIGLYERGALEAARRFSVEALAEDPSHAGARALLTRVQSERKPAAARPPTQAATRPVGPGSRTPTTDDPTAPTVHIPAVQRPDTSTDLPPTIMVKPGAWPSPSGPKGPTRVNQPSPTPVSYPNPSDATVLIPPGQRPKAVPPVPPARTQEIGAPSVLDPAALFGSAGRPAQRPADETMLTPPAAARRDPPPRDKTVAAAKAPPVRAKATPDRWAGLSALAAGWKARTPRGAPPRGPSTRPGPSLIDQYGLSLAIAGGLVVVIAAAVTGALYVGGFFGTSGHLLTITRPANGTISAAGLRCGSEGSDCSTHVPDGEAVEFSFAPDEGYAFEGYTGDCAPAGRLAMTGPKTCGATFQPVVAAASGAKTWTLTILMPQGGTLIAAGGIECGTMGVKCSTEIPDGQPVTVLARADDNFVFSSFTEGCAPSGNTLMRGPVTCGAIFTPRGSGLGPKLPQPPIARNSPPASPPGRGSASSPPAAPSNPAPPAVPPPADQAPVAVASPEKPPAAVISDDDHAKKNEIPVLLKQYCAALESLDPKRVKEIYPDASLDLYKRAFEPYRSLKCTMAEEPKYASLDGTKGTAQLEVGVKQMIEYRRGDAPEAMEFITTMTLSRPEARTTWRIVKLQSIRKPKP
jgi:hypothetical protein